MHYTISDLSGRMVSSGSMAQDTSDLVYIPTQGVYILHSDSADTTGTIKLVVQ